MPAARFRHHTRTVRLARSGERGAIVLLAIAFITVLGVIFAALLTFASTGSSSLTAYRIERTRRYTADAALQSAVQRLKSEPTLNTESLITCLDYPVLEDTTAGNVISVVDAGSTVQVTCIDTPGVEVTSVDVDGGQRPRDITLQVICTNSGGMTVDRKLSCGSGGTDTVIGSARVRFENQYPSDPPEASDPPPDERAVVPKVVSWSIRID